jgi:hypothetical protein
MQAILDVSRRFFHWKIDRPGMSDYATITVGDAIEFARAIRAEY